jgi:hypothetical protein
LVELALRYGHGNDQAVLEEVERELRLRSAGEGTRELFFARPEKVNLRRWQEFLEDLRKQEDCLREKQVKITGDLGQVQAARRAVEKTLKEMLCAERWSFASDGCSELHATEEEIVAGLQELKTKGGVELRQFIGELEQVLHDGFR